MTLTTTNCPLTTEDGLVIIDPRGSRTVQPKNESREPLLSVLDFLSTQRQTKSDEMILAAAKQLTELPFAELGRAVRCALDPLDLWFAHRELNRRGVPPCLRLMFSRTPPYILDAAYRDDSKQVRYISWLADVLWVCTRYGPGSDLVCLVLWMRGQKQNVGSKGWRALLALTPDTKAWHQKAFYLYKHSGNEFHRANASGLSDKQRQDLITMPTSAMRGDRKILDNLHSHHEALLLYAAAHPDRSGHKTAGEIAKDRSDILAAYLLAGRNKSLAVAYLEFLTDRKVSRQNLVVQIQLIEAATKIRGLALSRKS